MTMAAAQTVLRIIVYVVTVIVVGTTLVIGFLFVVEPFHQAGVGQTPAALGWGNIPSSMLGWTAAAGLSLLVVLVVWVVAAPIRSDKRQQFRRR
jgi:hypothetical protein